MTSYKHLFQRAIAAAPDRLHAAAHSHHLWPDASYVGQLAAWQDGVRLADRKWERVMGEVWPAAQRHVARELKLPDPENIVFAGNTHDFLLRIVSAMGRKPVRILSTDAEFHSFRRQAARWVEGGTITLETIPNGDEAALLDRAASGDHDLIFTSQVFFSNGRRSGVIAQLAALARPDGPWVVIDGYHGFMAVETDLSAIADRVFYLAGGYKYAMAGEGVAILHAPPGYGARPEITGWYAEFDDLSLPPGSVGYAPDARRYMGATFDPSGLYRFVAVRDMLAGEGLTTAAINDHVAGLRTKLLEGIAATPLAQAELLNPPGPGSQGRFLAFRSPHAAQWKAKLEAEDVITDVRGDVLRIGLGLYHDDRDIDRLLGELEWLEK
ncbi:class V aminotransferase [Sphingomonas sp. G-3-2-10]|uniref:kynureninase/PvdN C-terminal domain-containing protein n=1 Tax=Sphingomonas sp. G-3-2-10 TaxID=2728838 RepID=UPI00146B07E3|nr:class V aminotransferase [Sphingomonas sp. G-3-2-10]NML06960.1 class V aminotransferase [Sphingomonas sp. G-3-2-10]